MCVSLYDCKLGCSPDVIETLSLIFLFMVYTEHHLLDYRAQQMYSCVQKVRVFVLRWKKNVLP